MMPVALAVAVWGSCPAYAVGDDFPVPAQPGCPVPVAGLIYPYEHEGADLAMLEASKRAASDLRACAEECENDAEEWSPAVWFAIGAAVGVAAGIGIGR